MKKDRNGQAIIECFQAIPCNPCTSTCKAGAITMKSLTDLPVFDAAKCIGCKMCVAACPGQAIFFMEDGETQDHVRITFPYEYLPLPQEGATVMAADRNGKEVCEAQVVKVDTKKIYNKTVLVTLEIPKRYQDDVRFMIRL